MFVQLNEYETDPYFLQIFQSNTTVCLIIMCFVRVANMIANLKLSKRKSKQKMTQETKQKQFYIHNHVRNSYKAGKPTLFCIGNSEENSKYRSVSHFFIYTNRGTYKHHRIFWKKNHVTFIKYVTGIKTSVLEIASLISGFCPKTWYLLAHCIKSYIRVLPAHLATPYEKRRENHYTVCSGPRVVFHLLYAPK